MYYVYILYILYYIYICHQCVCAHYPYRNSSIHYTRCPKAPGLNHHLSVGSVARWINVGIFANIGIWPRQRWGLWNFPLKMVIFYSYVSLPEGIWSYFDGDVIAKKRLTRKYICGRIFHWIWSEASGNCRATTEQSSAVTVSINMLYISCPSLKRYPLVNIQKTIEHGP